jgi:hypothetical protein
MTYTVPPKKPDPKQRFVRVTDPAEIEAIQRNGLGDPIGGSTTECGHAVWYAEAHSLRQFRGLPVEFDV